MLENIECKFKVLQGLKPKWPVLIKENTSAYTTIEKMWLVLRFNFWKVNIYIFNNKHLKMIKSVLV